MQGLFEVPLPEVSQKARSSGLEAATAAQVHAQRSRLIDLSLVIRDGLLAPPSVSRPVEMRTHYRGPGHWQSSELSLLLHTGSHVDFPRHCDAEGAAAGDVSLERTCGEAIVADLGDLPARHDITVDDVRRFEHLFIRDRIVLVRTGWTDRMWGKFPDFYLTSPTCSRSAIAFIVAHGVKAVGFDCFPERAALDPDFTSEEFLVHKTIFDGGALLLQLMTGLGSLPKSEPVDFYGAFVRIEGAEGAPARFFARVGDGESTR